MSFRECIAEQLKSQTINKRQSDIIQNTYKKEFDKHVADGLSEIEADIKAQDAVEKVSKNLNQSSRNRMQHAIKNAQIIDFVKKYMSDNNASSVQAVSHVYQSTMNRAQAIEAEMLSMMNDFGKELGPDFFLVNRDHDFFEMALRSMTEDVADPSAAALGKVLKKIEDYKHARFTAAGGIMGKIENRVIQAHKKEALRAVSKEKWVNDIMQDLDMDKMVSLEDGRKLTVDEVKSRAEYIYEDVVSDGVHSLREDFESGVQAGGGRGDVARSRAHARFFHFKDFDAAMRYNNTYGTGKEGLIGSYMSELRSFSKDIAMVEKLGPKPDATARNLDTFMEIHDKDKGGRRNWVKAQYNILRGVGGNTDALWWRFLTGVQNVMRSSLLGAASLSAISDTAFIGATAKINGLSATRALGSYGKVLAGSKNLKGLARRTGLLTDVINGGALHDTRIAGEMNKAGDGKIVQTTSWLSSLTNQASGLARMTDAASTGIALEGLTTIADQIKEGVSWSKLDPDFRASLSKFGVEEADWKNIKKAGTTQTDEGVDLLIPQELRMSDKLDVGVSKGIADKIDDWVQALKQQATNEGTLATRAITTGAAFGDGSAGSMSRAFSSSLFMFKTFPITVMMTHILPAIRRAGLDESIGKLAKGDVRGSVDAVNFRKMDHLAMVVIPTTIIGALAMQLKDISKGKTPKDMDSYQFWQAAFLQGGGLGLFGDFFLGDYSRFGRNPITEMGGPMAGLMSDILGVTKGNFDKSAQGKDLDNMKRDVFRLLKRNMPLHSLWYTRLLMERTLLDSIERMADPNFDKRVRRMEKRMQENGQEFWWAPGESPEPSKVKDKIKEIIE